MIMQLIGDAVVEAVAELHVAGEHIAIDVPLHALDPILATCETTEILFCIQARVTSSRAPHLVQKVGRRLLAITMP